MERLPAEVSDRILDAMRSTGETVLHLDLSFTHRLDCERLARAIELVQDWEPVLGSRLVLEDDGLFWEPLPAGQRGRVEVVSTEADLELFLCAPHDPATGPQIAARVWPGPAGDRLLLRIGHDCADAGAARQVGETMAAFYNRLATVPDLVTAPPPERDRSVRQVLDLIAWWQKIPAFFRLLRQIIANELPRPTRGLWLDPVQAAPIRYARRDLDCELVRAAADRGRRTASTLNDIVLAAFLRTMARLGDGEPAAQLRAVTTIDLRRYLPGRRARGICNLSAFEHYNLGPTPGPDFATTLDRVSRASGRLRATRFGLCSWLFAAPLVRALSQPAFRGLFRSTLGRSLRRRNQGSVLTNMGPITDAATTFDHPAAQCLLWTPPIRPPWFGMELTGYQGALSLTAGTFAPNEARIGPFMAGMEEEIRTWVGQAEVCPPRQPRRLSLE